jgi:hypothetical protein
LKLRGVYYDWDEEHGSLHDMGFIAEEVGDVVPEIMEYETNLTDESNWYINEKGEKKLYATGVDYGALTPILVEAIKNLKAEKDLEISELKEENKLIKEELCKKDNSYSWCE